MPCRRAVTLSLALLAAASWGSDGRTAPAPPKKQTSGPDTEAYLYRLLNEDGKIELPGTAYVIFVRGLKGRKLLQPVIKHKDGKGEVDLVSRADEAELRVDMPRKMILIHMRNCNSHGTDRSRAYFQEHTWDVPLPRDFGKK
jgi:hypothetical protein